MMGFIKKYLLVFIVLSTCFSLTASCTASPTIPPTANGEEPETYQIGIDLLGAKHEASVDSQGKLTTSAQLTSSDGAISLSIDKDTILLDKDKKPLQLMEATIDPNPPPLPEDTTIVGPIYDFRPEGANFNPFVILTLSYDPEELPERVREKDVYIGYYRDAGWNMLRYKNVDTENHRVTTQIDHFARFAVLAPLPTTEREQPTSEAPSAPADRVEVVYFYRAQCCSGSGCSYAEAGTRYTVETYFKDELDNGKVTFEVYNVEDKENATVVKKYGAFTSSLFINTVRGGSDHIEPVMDIWFILGDDEAFVEVVKSKIETSLKEVG